jgi:hypothetical protein
MYACPYKNITYVWLNRRSYERMGVWTVNRLRKRWMGWDGMGWDGMDGWMDGWKDERMDWWTGGLTDQRMEWRTDGRME